jgi:hypothetical protein
MYKICSSETSVSLQSTWCYNQEGTYILHNVILCRRSTQLSASCYITSCTNKKGKSRTAPFNLRPNASGLYTSVKFIRVQTTAAGKLTSLYKPLFTFGVGTGQQNFKKPCPRRESNAWTSNQRIQFLCLNVHGQRDVRKTSLVICALKLLTRITEKCILREHIRFWNNAVTSVGGHWRHHRRVTEV